MNLKNNLETSEKHPEENAANTQRAFVVQRHDASHLHFDFRLEIEGVLKSWAVPKGPSLNPSDKRLAVMVDDHSLDYGGFEGTIPEGNYGAGTVEIWDSGTWVPANKNKLPTESLDNGELEFSLDGQKLKGKFVMVRMKHANIKNGWLLIKKEDAWSTTGKYDAKDIPSH